MQGPVAETKEFAQPQGGLNERKKSILNWREDEKRETGRVH